MSYHHVIIRLFESERNPRSIISDASEKELLSEFVHPYRAGKDILLGSELFRLVDIRTVLIVRTERPEAIERDEINEADLKEIGRLNAQSDGFVIFSTGRGYDPEDILDVGTDVTAQYIKGPPGQSSALLRTALHNPWIVTIGAGLIVAALVASLGLS